MNGYCRNRPGSRFVERGDYEVMRATDSQIITHSEFVVESGMTLAMAILMRQNMLDQNNKCPRCDHLNSDVILHDGWIEWQVLINICTIL
jgi:hypothetical protein